MMDRVGDPRVSPTDARSSTRVRSTDWDGNQGVSALWVADVDGGEPRRLAISAGGASTGRWAADGQAIYFLSSRGGSNQVWRADAQGKAAVQVTTLPVDVVALPRLAGRQDPDRSPCRSSSTATRCSAPRTGWRRKARRSTVPAYDRMPLRQFDHWNDGRRSICSSSR